MLGWFFPDLVIRSDSGPNTAGRLARQRPSRACQHQHKPAVSWWAVELAVLRPQTLGPIPYDDAAGPPYDAAGAGNDALDTG